MAVKSILQNPCYRGRWRGTAARSGRSTRWRPTGRPSEEVAKTTRNPGDRWIVIENVHEAIVPPDLF